ncbi:uncharacterized protein N7511_004341 [Penicillium nucicola]|uniref:uncharacterized protein n=1 Tax=Penicillium nucicola TaxID=1850975 RepID=UPI0025456D7F|nr:uncharacterized protein N7511_004341 [Penicillium nucicola]KAJ5766725.1 hypothetical protein N7511_004341 [Penicillium nucicola]
MCTETFVFKDPGRYQTTSTVDDFETQFLTANPYGDSSDVCRDTLDKLQSDMQPSAPQSHIQRPPTPPLPLFWVGDDNTFNGRN